MPLGTEVGLGTDDIVLDKDPASPPQKGAEPPSPNTRNHAKFYRCRPNGVREKQYQKFVTPKRTKYPNHGGIKTVT